MSGSEARSTSRPSPKAMASMLSALQTELAAERAATVAKVAALEDTIANLAHENALLKRRLFGNKTERAQTSELQLALGDLLEDEARLKAELDKAVTKTGDDAPPSPPAEDPEGKGRPTGHGRRNLRLSKLPRTVVDILDEALEAKGHRRIGFEESSQLGFRRGGFFVVLKRVAKYEVAARGEATVVSAPTPKTLFPRALLHPSAVAHLITSKFSLGVPHYRLEQELAAQGMPLDRGLMSRYVEHAGNTLGATVVAAMWRDAIATGHVISTDATGALVQPTAQHDAKRAGKTACKKGHFFTAVVDARSVLFAYAEAHTSELVKELFGDFRGYLQADASAVYDVLERGPPTDTDEGLKLVGCWAHARRYFFEAALCRYPVGVQGLLRIGALFAMELHAQRVPRGERVAFRRAHLGPVMDDFFSWARDARATTPGRNLATKALGYAMNQEAELRRVLDDADLPLDNTRAERALRKIVVGRKNWLFYGSDTHAEAAAALFSVIASCRLHGLDAFTYLDEVLRLLPSWPADRYLELAPPNWAHTRARLDPAELDRPIASFTIPPLCDSPSQPAT